MVLESVVRDPVAMRKPNGHHLANRGGGSCRSDCLLVILQLITRMGALRRGKRVGDFDTQDIA